MVATTMASESRKRTRPTERARQITQHSVEAGSGAVIGIARAGAGAFKKVESVIRPLVWNGGGDYVLQSVRGFGFRDGMWRSPVAHLNGVQGVAGSNPVIPMSCSQDVRSPVSRK